MQYAQPFHVPTCLDAKELLRLAMADGNAQKVKKNAYLYDNTQRANFRGKPFFNVRIFGVSPFFNMQILSHFQRANFWGKPLFQATKQQLNNG